jgi:hypothetical protein
MSEIVEINAGGTHQIFTTLDVLRSDPGSYLEKMFSGQCEFYDRKIFIDRDGEAFTALINYLRNGMSKYPEIQSKDAENLFL